PAPARDKHAPTKIANTTLGKRTFIIICSVDSAQSPENAFPKPGICCNKIPHTCERGSFAVPIDKLTITEKRRSIRPIPPQNTILRFIFIVQIAQGKFLLQFVLTHPLF